MYTIGDAVREHVKQYRNNGANSTSDGMKWLELPDEEQYYGAGNMYLSALGIIAKLQDKINELQGRE